MNGLGNHATVKLDSSVASRGMKTCSESRIELRNLQILKKILDKSSQFLSSEQPSEPENLDVTLNIAGVENILSENLRLRRPLVSSFERKGALMRVEICVSLKWCRRHLAAIQLPVGCSELNFAHRCALKRTGTFVSQSKVMCLF